MIKLETVRILHFQQGLTLHEIDDHQLPAFQMLRSGQANGLIWEAFQRSTYCSLYPFLNP